MAMNVTRGPTTSSFSSEANFVLSNLVTDMHYDIDLAFVTISGWLVFFMQCGFAMLSVGAVRKKNCLNMILYLMLDATVGAIGFYLLGFGFAYGDRMGADGKNLGNGFIGSQYFALSKLPYGKGKSQFYDWFFQYTFAATASTIVSGSVIERTKIAAYIVYSLFLTAFVYPVVAHWEWSPAGWLNTKRVGAFLASDADIRPLFSSGILDFAGCGAVHMVGGVSGLVGAYLVGPRAGRFNMDGSANPMPGHNVPFSALGTLVLWFGWYGFNCGSAGALIGYSDVISRVAMTTTLGGAAGGITTLAYAVLLNGCWDVTACLNGTLAGLVSITSGCAFFEPWAAIVTGGIGGVIFPALSAFLLRRGIDDPLEAAAMHGGCGAWGLLATGLLAQTKAVNAMYGLLPNGAHRPGGGFYGHGQLLAANLVGIVTIGGWVAANMTLCFGLLKMCNLLRISSDVEDAGMDLSYHGSYGAYPMGGDDHGTVVYETGVFNGGSPREMGLQEQKDGSVRRGNAVVAVGAEVSTEPAAV